MMSGSPGSKPNEVSALNGDSSSRTQSSPPLVERKSHPVASAPANMVLVVPLRSSSGVCGLTPTQGADCGTPLVRHVSPASVLR